MLKTRSLLWAVPAAGCATRGGVGQPAGLHPQGFNDVGAGGRGGCGGDGVDGVPGRASVVNRTFFVGSGGCGSVGVVWLSLLVVVVVGCCC